MKASELIHILEELIKENGDLEVEIPQTDNSYYGHTSIKTIEVTTDTNNSVIELER